MITSWPNQVFYKDFLQRSLQPRSSTDGKLWPLWGPSKIIYKFHHFLYFLPKAHKKAHFVSGQGQVYFYNFTGFWTIFQGYTIKIILWVLMEECFWSTQNQSIPSLRGTLTVISPLHDAFPVYHTFWNKSMNIMPFLLFSCCTLPKYYRKYKQKLCTFLWLNLSKIYLIIILKLEINMSLEQFFTASTFSIAWDKIIHLFSCVSKINSVLKW